MTAMRHAHAPTRTAWRRCSGFCSRPAAQPRGIYARVRQRSSDDRRLPGRVRRADRRASPPRRDGAVAASALSLCIRRRARCAHRRLRPASRRPDPSSHGSRCRYDQRSSHDNHQLRPPTRAPPIPPEVRRTHDGQKNPNSNEHDHDARGAACRRDFTGRDRLAGPRLRQLRLHPDRRLAQPGPRRAAGHHLFAALRLSCRRPRCRPARTSDRSRSAISLPTDREIERYTYNHSLTVTLDHQFASDWGLDVQLPLVTRPHSTIRRGHRPSRAIPTRKGIGDLRVVGRWQGLSTPGNVTGIEAGLVLPTGEFHQTFQSGPRAARRWIADCSRGPAPSRRCSAPIISGADRRSSAISCR